MIYSDLQNLPVNTDKFFLTRHAYEDDIYIDIPGQGQYIVDLDTLRLWLNKMSLVEHERNSVLDYLWNFRKVGYDLKTRRLIVKV